MYVTLPVRLALAGFLALRRQWWHLAAFTAAIVLSEVLIGSLKGIYDRARPPGSLVATSGASFPSGHAIAASVIVSSSVALVPAHLARRRGGGRGGARGRDAGHLPCYLAAHWRADAIAWDCRHILRPVTAATADQFLARRRPVDLRPAGTQSWCAFPRPATLRTGDPGRTVYQTLQIADAVQPAE